MLGGSDAIPAFSATERSMIRRAMGFLLSLMIAALATRLAARAIARVVQAWPPRDGNHSALILRSPRSGRLEGWGRPGRPHGSRRALRALLTMRPRESSRAHQSRQPG